MNSTSILMKPDLLEANLLEKDYAFILENENVEIFDTTSP